MRKRLFPLFAVFAAVAILALLFIMAYRGLMGARLQSYVLGIRRCQYLSEAQCGRHPGCQAYYEPARGDAVAVEFRACQSVTALTTAAQPVCAASGGTWKRSKFGDYCDCSALGKQYLVDKGCR
ncbi:MAG: hypothetical protein Q7S23_05290 [bacterium]|nr:hypothetical protein [bacterium]